MKEGRPRSFYVLAIFFAAYVLFLYGPMIAIYVLSFQGPQGGLTFPMNGVSTFWIAKLFQGTGIIDLGAAFRRSLLLGVIVMIVTCLPIRSRSSSEALAPSCWRREWPRSIWCCRG